jgi:hypothetical protein
MSNQHLASGYRDREISKGRAWQEPEPEPEMLFNVGLGERREIIASLIQKITFRTRLPDSKNSLLHTMHHPSSSASANLLFSSCSRAGFESGRHTCSLTSPNLWKPSGLNRPALETDAVTVATL